jgi:hypothetical protein
MSPTPCASGPGSLIEKIPQGVIEVVTAWAKGGGDKTLTDAVARSGFHMMALLDAKWCVATAHEYVLRQWQSSGGQMPDVAPSPYPDERYTTKLMFWDRDDFEQYAAPGQADKIRAELRLLKGTPEITERIAAVLDRAQAFGGRESWNTDNAAAAVAEELGLTPEPGVALKLPGHKPFPAPHPDDYPPKWWSRHTRYVTGWEDDDD